MATTLQLEKRLRLAGILVIVGLLVEGVCLLWAGPLAFIFLVAVGGFLCTSGIAVYFYSLVSSAEAASKP
jgi:hypothetical protein